jgi:hypothetical protein
MLSTPVPPTEKKKKAKEKEGAAMLMVKAWMQIQAEKAEKMKLAAAAGPGTLLSQPTFSASGIPIRSEEDTSNQQPGLRANNNGSSASEEVHHSTREGRRLLCRGSTVATVSQTKKISESTLRGMCVDAEYLAAQVKAGRGHLYKEFFGGRKEVKGSWIPNIVHASNDPPFLIFKGVTGATIDSGLDAAGEHATCTPSAWINAEVFKKWIKLPCKSKG